MKIGLTGTSCAGKTTLAKQLSEYFNFDIVKEIARNYNKDDLIYENIQYNILFDQIRAELLSKKDVVTDRTVIDNYIHIILRHKSRKSLLHLIRSWVETYDIIFLCKKLPFIEDGFRINTNIEPNLITFMKNNLIDYYVLEGNKEERFEKAKIIIERKLS